MFADCIERLMIGSCVALLLMSCASPPPIDSLDGFDAAIMTGGNTGGGGISGGTMMDPGGSTTGGGGGSSGGTTGKADSGIPPIARDAGATTGGQMGGAFHLSQVLFT